MNCNRYCYYQAYPLEQAPFLLLRLWRARPKPQKRQPSSAPHDHEKTCTTAEQNSSFGMVSSSTAAWHGCRACGAPSASNQIHSSRGGAGAIHGGGLHSSGEEPCGPGGGGVHAVASGAIGGKVRRGGTGGDSARGNRSGATGAGAVRRGSCLLLRWCSSQDMQ